MDEILAYGRAWPERREATLEGYRKQILEETGIDPGSDPACRPIALQWLLQAFCGEVAIGRKELEDFPPTQRALIFYLAEFCYSHFPLQITEEMLDGSHLNNLIVEGHLTQGQAYKIGALLTGKSVAALRMNHKRFLKKLAGARDPLMQVYGREDPEDPEH
jgi:hypothetical protein